MPAFADWREMLARADLALDVVDIVAPNALHGEIALAALDAGLHVLVEKPLATTLDACDAIVERARRDGRMVAVGHELRLSPLWGRVKAEIASGRIGRPLSCSIHLWRRSFRAGSSGWRHDPARVGSWILEEPIHYFDLARWYLADLGEPRAVYARANGRGGAPSIRRATGTSDNRQHASDMPSTAGAGSGLALHETMAAIVSWGEKAAGQADGGFAAISQTTAGAEHHLVAEVVGMDASLRAVWSAASDRSEAPTYRLELATDDAREEIPLVGAPTETGDLEAEIAGVVRAVTLGEAPPAGAEDGRWAVRLCLAAEESARTGCEVALEGGRRRSAKPRSSRPGQAGGGP